MHTGGARPRRPASHNGSREIPSIIIMRAHANETLRLRIIIALPTLCERHYNYYNFIYPPTTRYRAFVSSRSPSVELFVFLRDVRKEENE